MQYTIHIGTLISLTASKLDIIYIKALYCIYFIHYLMTHIFRSLADCYFLFADWVEAHTHQRPGQAQHLEDQPKGFNNSQGPRKND